MTLTPILETHIYLDEQGRPWVKRAGVSVRQVVESLRQVDFDPEQIVRDFPYLKLSEVHAVLTYYYDHREEVDAAIKAADELVAKIRETYAEPPAAVRVREAMRQAGKLP